MEKIIKRHPSWGFRTALWFMHSAVSDCFEERSVRADYTLSRCCGFRQFRTRDLRGRQGPSPISGPLLMRALPLNRFNVRIRDLAFW